MIIFDEATASVDSATDAFLQSAIRELFADSTVLTIAHRLATVADADAVMVLSDGNVSEYDSPTALLAKRGGVFRGMVDALGEEAARDVEREAARAVAARADAAAGVKAAGVKSKEV